MTSQEFEALVLAVGPYVLAVLTGIVATILIMNRKKQPITCPVPSQVILDELQLLLADAFQKLPKDAFLREATKLYDTKYTLTKK